MKSSGFRSRRLEETVLPGAGGSTVPRLFPSGHEVARACSHTCVGLAQDSLPESWSLLVGLPRLCETRPVARRGGARGQILGARPIPSSGSFVCEASAAAAKRVCYASRLASPPRHSAAWPPPTSDPPSPPPQSFPLYWHLFQAGDRKGNDSISSAQGIDWQVCFATPKWSVYLER